MDTLLRSDVVKAAPDRWARQYAGPGQDEDKVRKGAKLAALKGTDFTAKQVADIIGNSSWSCLVCDECEQDVSAVVMVGADWLERRLGICADCLSKAVSLIAAE